MTDANWPLAQLALAMLSRCDKVAGSHLKQLSDASWEQLLRWSSEHRFTPALHYNLKHSEAWHDVPGFVQERLSDSYRQATLKSLSLQRQMILVSRLLSSAGIDHLFLKGAYLAWFAYPEPGMRPMRDLDVLVPASLALSAFDVLQQGGLVRIARYAGDPQAFLENSKHLPPLMMPGGSSVEVHTMTIAPSKLLLGRQTTCRYEALEPLATSRLVAGTPIRFPGPEDQLVHLCVHAAIDHQFDNGPLILSDVDQLLRTHEIDWPMLWQRAAALGAERGLALVLRLVEAECPDTRIEWPGPSGEILPRDASIVTVARRSLFRSVEARGDVALQARLDEQVGLAGKSATLMGRAFPSRTAISREFPVSAHSARAYLYYPVKWTRLLGRLLSFTRSSFSQRARSDVENVSQIIDWLKGPEGRGASGIYKAGASPGGPPSSRS